MITEYDIYRLKDEYLMDILITNYKKYQSLDNENLKDVAPSYLGSNCRDTLLETAEGTYYFENGTSRI